MPVQVTPDPKFESYHKLFAIDSGHFYAGLELGVMAAPIIHYMNGWSEEKIRAYCARKGWLIKEITVVEFLDLDDDCEGNPSSLVEIE